MSVTDPADKPILPVDDDEELTALLTDYLGKQGYRVEAAGEGPAGLQRARSGDHSLMVLDIMLPGMDGFQILKALRDGKAPTELQGNVASTELMGQLTRREDYDRWTSEYLN